MKTKLNIAEILKGYPTGTKLYSTLCGECELDFIVIGEPNEDTIIKAKFLSNDGKTHYINFFYDGSYFRIGNGECLLFPSKENRDWSKFKVEKPKFDPKTLQAFDKVLARIDSSNAYYWFADFVSAPANEKYDMPCIMSDEDVKMIIPYNEGTKHLVGTTEEAPEYYRYWED